MASFRCEQSRLPSPAPEEQPTGRSGPPYAYPHSPPSVPTSSCHGASSSPTTNFRPTLPRPVATKSKVGNGCTNCRRRRVKCDRERPSCTRCVRLNVICAGYMDSPLGSANSREIPAVTPKPGASIPLKSEEPCLSVDAMSDLPRLDTYPGSTLLSIDEDIRAATNIYPDVALPCSNDKTEHAQSPLRESTDSSESPETFSSHSTDPCSSECEESTVGQKGALLNRLMDYFYFIFSNSPISRPRYISHGSGVSEQRHESSQFGLRNPNSSGSSIENSPKQSRKRKADEDDDHGERQGPPSKGQKSDDHPDRVDPRLACPFFKKNPGKYQQRGSCTGPGWATAHRVKEHVYRHHTLPITCPRCHEEFENDRLKDQHFRASEQCEVQDRIPVEGIDSTQKELLRRRQRTHKYMTEAEKWNEIYLIIFPDADPTCLPSPYYEYSESSTAVDESPETEFSRYEQFLRRELPSHVQRQLELRIEERLNPIEESLRSELVGIIRDTQIHLFNTYRSLRSSTTETSGADTVTTVGIHNEYVDLGNQEPQRVEAQQLEDELQTFYQPPLLDDPWGFDDGFNGLLFDLSQMPPGSVDLDSGYWSVPQADMGKRESDL